MKSNLIKICVVTGSRADYGLLAPLMECIKREKGLQLQVLVTGMHLSPEFGLTYTYIEKDGFTINEKVEMLVSADTNTAIVTSMGIGLMGFVQAFNRLQPHWVIVLGDRFEILAAVVAAYTSKIPVAHLHGGELTEGALDDGFRHAITKMTYLHFTSTKAYRQRVIQLGESPSRVFNTGAIGIDNIKRLKLLSKDRLEKELDFTFSANSILVTYHPETLDEGVAQQHVQNLLWALDEIEGASILFTMPNADAGGRIIMRQIAAYVKKHPANTKVITNLGQLRYLSALQYVQLVAGNSSSGIIEVPYFKIPTVNIGSRQQGRLKTASVIDADTTFESISSALKKGLTQAFRNKCKVQRHIYGDGNASKKIVDILKKTGIPRSLKKTFYDLRP
jgi:GDP/UDP-N,N'-diacetylbacillosamine 2-epimerase (hydrolysing)